jgi:hypothetical protein
VYHSNRETPLIIVHVASHTVRITVHVLHNAMKWETADSIVAEWKSCNSYILENSTRHIAHITVYITHFTLQSIFLKALPVMQTEHLCDGIQYLTEDKI